MAALRPLEHPNENMKDRADVEVLGLGQGQTTYLMCILGGPNHIKQVPLNLKFSQGTTISFHLRSHGDEMRFVDLTGYLIPDELADDTKSVVSNWSVL